MKSIIEREATLENVISARQKEHVDYINPLELWNGLM